MFVNCSFTRLIDSPSTNLTHLIDKNIRNCLAPFYRRETPPKKRDFGISFIPVASIFFYVNVIFLAFSKFSTHNDAFIVQTVLLMNIILYSYKKNCRFAASAYYSSSTDFAVTSQSKKKLRLNSQLNYNKKK